MPGFSFSCLALAVAMLLFPATLRAAYTDADADQIFDAYNTAFYKTQTNNRAYYAENTDGGRAWFWGQANMMEMVADTYDRAPSQSRRDRLASLCRGFMDYHGTNWSWNEFNDDNIWACIVFTKTYLATGDTQYLDRARSNFDIVWNRGWATSLGGGLYWKTTGTGRNACVNAPAAIAACMLYDITGNTAYLDKAKSIITWMDANLVVTATGAIDDHITPEGTRVGWRFTYNQGTYVGACSALYRITGQVSYLENAIKAARYTRDSMCNAEGIFPNHGTSGDGGGFNGIGIRWISRMVKDQGLWDEFYPWLKANADAAWDIRRTADNLSWANWRAQTPAAPAVLYGFGCYGSVVALQVVPSVDPSTITGVEGPSAFRVQEAESATLGGPLVVTENSGFRGTGYADYGTAVGETITWTVNAEAAGSHWVSFRYANGGTTNRPLRVRVNGTVIQDLPFGATGGWKTWIHTPGLSVPLVAGNNTIQLAMTTNNGPNVDLLYVSAPPKAAPVGAVMLFDGTTQSLTNNWKRDENGAAANWTVGSGAMGVVQAPARNDISTVEGFKDFKLHLEWLAPPGGLGQEAANSGVKLQGRYEIQILNTPRGQTALPYIAGAIQQRKAPDSNASLGAGHWQSYDIDFTAARWNGATKTADARVTVRWNGVLIHNNVALTSSTESSPAEAPGWHPILLQAQASTASGAVRFRNVWVQQKNRDPLQAEQATLAGPATSTEHAGYQGTGYADYGNTTGETITWNVDSGKAGGHWISFRYANGGAAARPLNLVVNGNPVQQLPFAPSGAWPTWIFTPGVTVPLVAGNNTIQLISTMNSGPNVDYLYVGEPPRPAPTGALVLFDGTAVSLEGNWQRDENRGTPNWTVAQGALGVVTSPARNDISTKVGFKDFQLHLEWLSPPGGSGADAGNSGVKLQRGYEIQILNTAAGQAPAIDGVASIYQQKAPDSNASAGAGIWQSYDIYFTAPRWNGNVKTSNARVRIYWNNVLVHDDVALPQGTGPSPAVEKPGFHPLLLQAETSTASGAVQFRNIWVAGESAPLALSPGEYWNDWQDYLITDLDARGPGQDPDGDGIPNLWEYITGGNPMAPDRLTATGENRSPVMALVEDAGGRFVEFTFLRRADHQSRGLTFSGESSTTLNPEGWSPRTVTLSGAPVAVGDGTHERVKVRVDLPLAGQTQMFFRLRADLTKN